MSDFNKSTATEEEKAAEVQRREQRDRDKTQE